MGNNWSLSGAWQQTVVTQDDIIDAVRGFESWQKAQEEIKASGVVQHFDASSTLLDRVGGPTIVRRAVEIFCRRMYADEQLTPYLRGTDIVRLRAKQSSFLLWLLSPADQPASSRHPRTAHLPLIRAHGFNREHFQLGMRYMSEALREVGVVEGVLAEVMDKLRPYEDMTFTPLPREEEEERRLAALQRLRSTQQTHLQGQGRGQGARQHEQQHQLETQGQQQQQGRQQQLLRLDRTGSSTTSAATNTNSQLSVSEESAQQQVEHHQQHPAKPSAPRVAKSPRQPPHPASPYPPEATPPDLPPPPPPPRPHLAPSSNAEDPGPPVAQTTALTQSQPQPLPAQPKAEATGESKRSDPRATTPPPLPAAANSVTPHLPTPQESSGTPLYPLHCAPSPPPRSQARSRTHTGLVDMLGSSHAEAASSAPLPELPPWLVAHAGPANYAHLAITRTKAGGVLGNNRSSSSSSGAVGASSGGVGRGLRLAPLPAAAGVAAGGAVQGLVDSIGFHALALSGGGGGEGHLLSRPARSLPHTGVSMITTASDPDALPLAAERHTTPAATMYPVVTAAADSDGDGHGDDGNARSGVGCSPLDACTEGEGRVGRMRATAAASGSQFVAAAGILHLPPPPPFSPPLAVRQMKSLSSSSSPLRGHMPAAGAAVPPPPPPMSPPLPSLPSPLRPMVMPPPPPSAGGSHSLSSHTSSGTNTPVYGTAMPPSSNTS